MQICLNTAIPFHGAGASDEFAQLPLDRYGVALVSPFVDNLKASGLVAPEGRLARRVAELEQALNADGWRNEMNAIVIANELIAARLLSTWQCDMLLRGRTKGFFVGGCKLISYLGRGKASSAYVGEQVALGRRVSIKVFPPDYASRPSFCDWWQARIRTLADSSAMHLPRLIDFARDGTCVYLVREYVEGVTLGSLATVLGVTRSNSSLAITAQLAAGVAEAHRAGVILASLYPIMLWPRYVKG